MKFTFNLDGRCEELLDDNGNHINGVQSLVVEADCDNRPPRVTLHLIPKTLELVVPDKFTDKVNHYTFTQQLE